MKRYYVELDKETCIISEIEDTTRLRTIIASGELNIMSDLGFYPVKAGTAEKVEFNEPKLMTS